MDKFWIWRFWSTPTKKRFTSITCILACLIFISAVHFFSTRVNAQFVECVFHPVSPALTDLGLGEYHRLTSINPLQYQPTGYIGGLYPGGSNSRPTPHELAGVSLAYQIKPLDANGNPDVNGKIGLTSIGMSNTEMEFGTFMNLVRQDTEINDSLKLVNGAAGGGVIERWADPNNDYFDRYWDQLEDKILAANLTDAQIQVVWVKITQQRYQPNFPQDMQFFQSQLEDLARLLKAKFPNLKITYFSSRIRSFAYHRGLSPEPTAFENGFAIRWMIEKQINGDPSLNYDAERGAVTVSYISWGPYLWIDGENPRSDGRTWPLSYVTYDCTHPTTEGSQAVAEMMMEFFKSDTTSIPWFLDPDVPTPIPTPTFSVTPISTPTSTSTATPIPTDLPTPMPTNTPTNTPVPTCTPIPTNTPIPDPTSTPASTDTPTPSDTPTSTSTVPPPSPTTTSTFTPTPTTLPVGGLISYWSFNNDQVTDDINGCNGCANYGAVWFTPSIVSGGYHFDGSNSSLNLGDFSHLNNHPAFTVSVWVRPNFDQTHTSWRYVFNDGGNIQLFFLSNNQDWRFTMRNITNTCYRIDTQGLMWNPNTWHLLTATYDGNVINFYWDGLLASSKSANGVVAGESGATLLGMSAVGGNNFDGDIDELRIYDYALSYEEVYNLFTNP